jgi:hypothetical protein
MPFPTAIFYKHFAAVTGVGFCSVLAIVRGFIAAILTNSTELKIDSTL